MRKNNISLKGFTLIELLVVISIIGILSSFAVVQLNSARNKARDALRKADMSQMRTAINLYYDENNKYPVCGSWDESSPDFGASVQAGSNCYNTALGSALTSGSKPYLGKLPMDPKNQANSPIIDATYIYRFVSKSDGSEYALAYRVEENSALQIIRGW